MVHDALRSLRSSSATTGFILLILTLTISAATVTFSVVDAVVLRPLPFTEPDRLVVVEHVRGYGGLPARLMTAVQFLAVRERTDAFESVAAVRRSTELLRSANDSERIASARVTASLFDVLRVAPLLGQTFKATHEVAGNDHVAVIGYRLWQRRFGGDAAIVGTTIQVADRSLVVLGVMPDWFSYPITSDEVIEIWTPYVIPADERIGPLQSSYLHIVGRVRPGMTLAHAQAQAHATFASLAASEPVLYRTGHFAVSGLKDSVVGPVRGWMLMVLLAVALLVAVACANVANLLLTRAIYRARELAIRASLGATRGRLVSSLLVESVLLSLLAVVLALVVAGWGVNVARASLPAGIARAHNIALDFRVFATAVAVSVITGLIFSVIPAAQAARADLVALLNQGAASVAVGTNRWRATVLVAQVSLASVLLVGTILFVASFIRVSRADLGFDRSNLLVVVASLRGLQWTVQDVVARLESVPGVVSVGGAAAASPPLVAAGFGGSGSSTRLQLPGAPGVEFVSAEFNRVTARYFVTAGILLRRGRLFGDADAGAMNVVVLDELAARRLFGDQDPIGREIVFSKFTARVIGIVANVQMRGPESETGPQAYFPGPNTGGSFTYLIRTSRPSASVAPAIQAAFASLLPAGSGPVHVRPIEDAFRNITARRRFSASSMSIFGLLALLIGATGVYGVMSSMVAQRTREIGVRMALGATTRQVVAAVLLQIGRYLGVGLMLGLPIAWMVSRTSASLFYQVQPTDLWIYLAVGGLVALVGLAAALIPARRAALVDPLIALRTE